MTYILNKISKILKYFNRQRIIFDRKDNEPYLERYYIFLKDRSKFPFNIFLHRFLKSDEAVLHDHPWPFWTFILSGGYWEWLPQFDDNGKVVGEYRVWRKPFQLRYAEANSLHRVELQPGIYPWTIFIPGKSVREWGFLAPKNGLLYQEWVNHETYHSRPN